MFWRYWENVKKVEDFFQTLWSSHNILALCFQSLKKLGFIFVRQRNIRFDISLYLFQIPTQTSRTGLDKFNIRVQIDPGIYCYTLSTLLLYKPSTILDSNSSKGAFTNYLNMFWAFWPRNYLPLRKHFVYKNKPFSDHLPIPMCFT